MADFNVSDVASRINPPQQISIGDMLNIARGAQAYKQAEQVNPLLIRQQQAETNLAEQVMNPKIEQQKYITEQAGIATKKSKFEFTQENAKVIQDEINALANDPRIMNAENTLEGRQNAVSALLEAKKRALKKGVDEHSLEIITAPTFTMAGTDPTKIHQELLNSMRAGTGAVGQANINNPSLEIINGVPQLVTKGTGNVQPLNINVPYQQPVTDVTGRTSIQQRGGRGEYIGTAPYPTTPAAQLGQPGQQSEFLNIPPGETKESLAVITGQRNAVNAAARQVPVQQFNANQIIKLADITDTGVGAETLRNLGGGYAALPWTNNNATNYDKLGHYIAANSISLAQQAGLSTDAGRSLQEQASGSTRFTKESLKSVARTNRALASGVDLLNRGIENSIQSTGNPFAARDFQNQWSQTVDVNALRLYDGLKNNDQQVIRDVVKELGGIKSKEYKTLLQRMDRMKQLIQGQR